MRKKRKGTLYLTTKAEQGVYHYIEYKITIGCWGACVAVGFLAGLLGAVWPVAVLCRVLGLSGPRQFLPPGHRGAEVRTVPGAKIGWGRSVKELCGGI